MVPLFYKRGSDAIPRDWVKKMRAGLTQLVPIFNSNRMVQEYMTRYYLPCSRRFNILCRNGFEGSKDLAEWRQKLMTGWHEVSIEQVISGNGIEKRVGQELEVTAKVRLGSLLPEDVIVEAYYGRLDQNGDFRERETVTLDVGDSAGDLYTYRGQIPSRKTGRFGYTVRIMPSHERLENPFTMGLVTWA